MSKQMSTEDGPDDSGITESDSTVTVEKDLVSQAEEEDMEALLGTYVILAAPYLALFYFPLQISWQFYLSQFYNIQVE